MTVYQLIRELSKYPADAEVRVTRSGQRREQRVMSAYRQTANRVGEKSREDVFLMTDWVKDEA